MAPDDSSAEAPAAAQVRAATVTGIKEITMFSFPTSKKNEDKRARFRQASGGQCVRRGAPLLARARRRGILLSAVMTPAFPLVSVSRFRLLWFLSLLIAERPPWQNE